MRVSGSCSARQRGQALILGVFLVLTTALATVLMYNNGQVTSEKTRLVNAADAAAYSGALFVARSLNFMAYTNRAMIANHVAVGHLVSYVSWIRYVDDSLDKIKPYTNWIPYVGAAVNYAERIIDKVKTGTEDVAPPLVQFADNMNLAMTTAQIYSRKTISGVMSVTGLANVKIMDKVAKSYASGVRVNDKNDVQTVGGRIAAAQVTTDLAGIFQFVGNYGVFNDDDRMRTMIDRSYNVSEPWVRGDRGWRFNLFFIKFNKVGNTDHRVLQNENFTDWEARDAMIVKRRKRFRWKTYIAGYGEAKASEFYENYQGIYGYSDLRNRGTDAKQTLKVSALATMPMGSTRFMDLMGLKPGAGRIAALSRAEVFHKRPEHGFELFDKEEYANLYNPFWQVRLTENQI